MAKSKRKTRPEARQRNPGEGAGREDAFLKPAPPEATNYEHPDSPGMRSGEPGIGIVGPDRAIHDVPQPDAPARRAAPGAARPGTTHSGISSAPSHGGAGGESPNPGATESISSPGADAPLSTPEQLRGPGPTSAGEAMGDTADPNFTAASRDRSDAVSDAGATRMDTGRKLGAIPPAPPKSRRPMCVRDVMTADVAVCHPSTELYYVARMMEERDCGAVPVVESTDSMKPVGIITDRDIVVRGLAKNQDALSLRAGDVMSSEVLTVTPEMPLDDCVKRMEQRQVRRAIVVDHTGRCCGIIAQADIARGSTEHEAGELVREVSKPEPGSSYQHYH